MRLISWNVNGLRACVQKGFSEFFRDVDADCFCLQETKLQPGQIELDLHPVLVLCREEGILRHGPVQQA